MEHQQILDIINAVSSSKLSSFEFEQDDVYINMTVQSKSVQQTPVQSNILQTDNIVPRSFVEQAGAVKNFTVNEINVNGTENQSDHIEGGQVVKSPLVGTFYSASSPDAENFVKVGDKVTKGQTLGIIEAMKLMNEIESEFGGTVLKILVENKEVVEYGQPLFVIKED